MEDLRCKYRPYHGSLRATKLRGACKIISNIVSSSESKQKKSEDSICRKDVHSIFKLALIERLDLANGIHSALRLEAGKLLECRAACNSSR
jgi:hypothetical protein